MPRRLEPQTAAAALEPRSTPQAEARQENTSKHRLNAGDDVFFINIACLSSSAAPSCLASREGAARLINSSVVVVLVISFPGGYVRHWSTAAAAEASSSPHHRPAHLNDAVSTLPPPAAEN